MSEYKVVAKLVADYKNFQTGMETAKKSISDFKEKASKISEGLGKAGEKATKALTLPIIGGATAAAKAAADSEAASAQFASVFGDLESEATSSLQQISSETGVFENALKGSFTKIAAFAKTTGAEQADALDIASRATMAAADSAAFYDRSVDEVAESLQSFLKGNYENDAALGISATETTRNAKANELYGKSFIELSEQQKQLTLLAMVEDGNKLSGALGQAARESDTFTTQLLNVKQGAIDVAAEFGKPILPAVVTLFKELALKAQALGNWFSSLSTEQQNLIVKFIAIVAVIGPMLLLVSKAIAIFTKLKTAFVAVKAGILALKGGMLATAGPIIAIIAVVGLLVTALIHLWKNNEAFRNKVIAIWNGIKNTFSTVWNAIKTVVSTSINTVKTTISTGMTSARNIASNILNSIKSKFSSIWTGIISGVTGFKNRLVNGIKTAVQGAYNGVINFFSKFKDAGKNIIGNIASGIRSAVGKVKDAAKNAVQAIRNLLPFSPPKDKSSPLADIHKNGIGTQIAKGIDSGKGKIKSAMNNALEQAKKESFNITGTVNSKLGNISGLEKEISAAGTTYNLNQPAYLTLSIGGQTFRAFVENISREQDRITNLELA